VLAKRLVGAKELLARLRWGCEGSCHLARGRRLGRERRYGPASRLSLRTA
jgi:hypothetical protein